MTDKLTLYTSPSAFPNPQRLRLMIHEKGIAARIERRSSTTWRPAASSGAGSTSR